jgi:cobalt/nickel transport system permease protein
VSGGHAHGLFVHAHSPIHRLAAAPKIVALVGWSIVVVLVPRESVLTFLILAGMIVSVMGLARIPWRTALRRVAVETPFVIFALALPFTHTGEQVSLLGVSVAVEGLWAAWNVVAKATLCTAAAVVLAASTQTADILGGLDKLRVPRVVTAMAGFMVRYIDVVIGEAKRMLLARRARGEDGGRLRQVRAMASIAGSLFIRTFERGERVYVSMLSRGYTGTMPGSAVVHIPSRDWALCAALPVLAAGIVLPAVVS